MLPLSTESEDRDGQRSRAPLSPPRHQTWSAAVRHGHVCPQHHPRPPRVVTYVPSPLPPPPSLGARLICLLLAWIDFNGSAVVVQTTATGKHLLGAPFHPSNSVKAPPPRGIGTLRQGQKDI